MYYSFSCCSPVLLEGRHAAPSCSAPAEKPVSKPEFPLLVVEEVHSKPVKETLIAENERLCSIWKESLKAQGKWRGDDLEVDRAFLLNNIYFD